MRPRRALRASAQTAVESSMRELSDRVAVVTGAGSGIGRALALELAAQGAHVAVADIDEALAQDTAREIEARGRRAIAVATDVRELASVELLLARTLAELGGCHVVCNNAGVFHAAALIDTPIEQWQRVIATNLWGVIHGSRTFGAHFARQGFGHIVNTASAAGLFPMPGMGSYSTTKFAIVGLSLQLRWELAGAGVGVTVVCPGVVRTGIGKAQGAGLERMDVDAMVARSPTPDRLARKVVRAVQRDRALVRYGGDSYLLSFLRVLPQWLIDPIGRFMGRTAIAFLEQNTGPKS
jgi:NAD(P)-dependent dehydrogenase (short-subunit alcohol dehydrogenase family)